jgi:iron-sulfur cluster repair protein YtfE (RIC family)
LKDETKNDRFKALDQCHQQIHEHLDHLSDLLGRLETHSDSAHCRQKAKTVEAFFSETARDHHAEEERNVFPNLLQSDNAELVQAVLTLKQDHGWIEQNWLELAPMLRGIAQGEDWVDIAELTHNVEVFLSLCHDHIELEETLIYPEAKSGLAQEMASRAARLTP